MTAKDALARYARRVGAAKAGQHLAVVRQYLGWGGDGTAEQFRDYIEHLRRKGYKSGTIAYHQRILRAFLHTAGLEVPVVWQHQEQEDTRIAFGADWIHQAIAVAQTDAVDPTDAWVLCLASVYGVRSAEVARLRPDDVDRPQARLFIHTAKHGEARWQWLPPAVARQWEQGGAVVTLKRVHQALKNIAAVGDLPLEPGADLHAIRRGLAVAMAAAGIPEGAAGRFMRWKLSAGRSAAAYREQHRYTHPTQVIGAAAVEAPSVPVPGSREEDAAVWDRHPFLGAWE